MEKKLNIYHGFINAVLKKILICKKDLKKIKINFEELPSWFQKNCNDLNNEDKDSFVNTYFQEPDIHLIFKDNKSLINFEKKIEPTSNTSGFIKRGIKLTNLPSFKKGNWWVQDFSSSLPLKKKIFLKHQ